MSFYNVAPGREQEQSDSESKSSSKGNKPSSSRGSASASTDADMAAVSILRSTKTSNTAKDSQEEPESASSETRENAPERRDALSEQTEEPDTNPEADDSAESESPTELVSVPGPSTTLPQVPYAAPSIQSAPQPNLYVQPAEESRGLLSRLFGRRKVTPTSTSRIPTSFTSDYTRRDPNAILPAVLSGNGLNGKDIPIGMEDQYRLASALPLDFRPTDLVQIPREYCHYNNQLYLRSEAAASLCQMIYDAQCQGLNIEVVSAFRDYSHQLRLYTQAVARKGENQKSVARPGKSEHYLGTTVDLTNSSEHTLKRSFGDTPEGRWLAANAHRYGWKMTVMAGNGRRSHNDEPWHLRYLGSSVNTYTRNSAVAQTQPQSQPRDVMGKIGRFLGLRR